MSELGRLVTELQVHGVVDRRAVLAPGRRRCRAAIRARRALRAGSRRVRTGAQERT